MAMKYAVQLTCNSIQGNMKILHEILRRLLSINVRRYKCLVGHFAYVVGSDILLTLLMIDCVLFFCSLCNRTRHFSVVNQLSLSCIY